MSVNTFNVTTGEGVATSIQLIEVKAAENATVHRTAPERIIHQNVNNITVAKL
jgi:hypothetical protein